jgi:hypothetical protein
MITAENIWLSIAATYAANCLKAQLTTLQIATLRLYHAQGWKVKPAVRTAGGRAE